MNTSMHRGGLWMMAAGLAAAAGTAMAADQVSNNLSNANGGSESATEVRRLTASFGAGAESHDLTSVTLLLGNPVMGDATVAIYTDGGLEPGELLATLSSPSEYSEDLAETVFTTAGVPIEAGETYWVVLTAETGEFSWGWASDTSGSGEGFQGQWGLAVPSDGDFAWWTQDIYPLQMAVGVDEACAADFNGDGAVNTLDVLAFLNAWSAGDAGGDFNGDGSINTLDVLAFLNAWSAGC